MFWLKLVHRNHYVFLYVHKKVLSDDGGNFFRAYFHPSFETSSSRTDAAKSRESFSISQFLLFALVSQSLRFCILH